MILNDKIRMSILEELYWHGPLKITGIPISQTFREKFLLQMLIEGWLVYRDEIFWDLTNDGNILYEKLAKVWDF
jgi:hypothetical protein